MSSIRWSLLLAACFGPASALAAQESLWIEAEHLDGIKGYCWPMGTPAMKKTNGHWGLSGPGWAAEWNQGGESGFLSIACGADDDKAVATKSIEIPTDGKYFVWVRYGDWREKTERFQIKVEQDGAAPWTGRYGEHPAIDEDNEMKLYFGWAFVWAKQETTLKKGPAKLSLLSTTKDPEPRQVDVIVLTTDAEYRPRIKDRPTNHAWNVLKSYRPGIPADLLPLARTQPGYELPPAWQVKTFKDKGFRYLWNVSADKPANWLSDDPKRVLYPYNVADEETRKEFEKKYGGQKDVPIFADPRIVPTFYGLGPGIFATDPKTGEVLDGGKRFAKWLDAHPDRMWAMMSNYHQGVPIGPKGQEQFLKYRDRYMGAIAGESITVAAPDGKALEQATANVTTRRQLAEAMTPLVLKATADKFRSIYGKDLDKNAYEDTIGCPSVGNTVYAPLMADWGARTIGYESAAMTSSLLAMRMAFMRGAARQMNVLTATYRSCNFGDSATMFSKTQSYSDPKNILDNYYSVYSGAGMTWYKFDIWYQYMAGSSMFYHEQGFDEFWKPGGTTAAGLREVQLSPKGLLVDRFLRLSAQEPDRGSPYTPIAFLLDSAHGWEPSPYWPNAFKNMHGHPDKFRFGDHEQMLHEYFWTAYYPIGPESTRPITGTNEVNVAGVFGDIFDVIFAYPDVKKWRSIDTYPVVVAAGDIELTADEGKRLAQYVQNGGTLVVADTHLTGPGVAALGLPKTGAVAEATGYKWMGSEFQPSQRYRYRPITGGMTLATTPDGQAFCTATDQGKGRLIYLAVPRGLGIDRQALPVLPRLLAHLSRGLMPIEVQGEVEWLVNRTKTGWAVTLLNPAGQLKPQQGILPTDTRENRVVTIKCRVPVTTARDRLLPSDKLDVKQNTVQCEVSAGSVRIIELK
jgi:hypothetical protein